MSWDSLILAVPPALGGMLFATLLLWVQHRLRVKGYKRLASAIVRRAEKEAHQAKQEAELKIRGNQLDQQRELEQIWQIERRKMAREEERLKQREDKLDGRIQQTEKKLSELERREATLEARSDALKQAEEELSALKANLLIQLRQAAGLTNQEARAQLLKHVEDEVRQDMANLTRRILREAEESAEAQASRIIATAINRMASSTVSEATVTTVALRNDEMKGRIIGREGRNIRALEKATGITFIVDETPGAVVLSGFDPVRKHIAKVALNELVVDGRIHPTRIEEVVVAAKARVQQEIRSYGEDAAMRAGVMDLHPEILILLGKLKFRYSYGQNVLDHSLEVAHLMGIMAAELGLNARLAKRIGLLHDMGKAVSHEVEGTHAIIGHNLSLKYGESTAVANGIGCHHNEMTPITVEGSLCGAADTISAARPGARIEAVEEYIKRLNHLERIAQEYPGVESAYAMQAGKEVRVVVMPEMIDDDGITNLARDLTHRIEKELSYPGKIKVTIIRETRAVEYAM